MSTERPSLDRDRQAELLALAGELQPELHRYCARLMGSVIDGEDVVQDTLVRAVVALQDLEVKGLEEIRGLEEMRKLKTTEAQAHAVIITCALLLEKLSRSKFVHKWVDFSIEMRLMVNMEFGDMILVISG